VVIKEVREKSGKGSFGKMQIKLWILLLNIAIFSGKYSNKLKPFFCQNSLKIKLFLLICKYLEKITKNTKIPTNRETPH